MSADDFSGSQDAVRLAIWREILVERPNAAPVEAMRAAIEIEVMSRQPFALAVAKAAPRRGSRLKLTPR